MKNRAFLEINGLKLKYGDKAVLDGVTLKIEPREVLVVMGLSGGGKTTLLNLLLRLMEPTSGTIMFRGEELLSLERRELNRARTRIGMVFQNAALISSMTVAENLALPLRELSDKTPKEIDKAIDEKLELVDLKDAREKLPGELSGGMKKRVGLARALMLDPELVLFDEPSAGLDPIATERIDDLILELKEEHNVTSIVVTHEMESAFAVASRMAFLDKGKIIFDGTPDEIKGTDNKVIQKFLAPYLAHERTGELHHANS
ncbi:MAG: ATP-binding cassette domain-containing protein [Methylacidiphilales bacterium]|nr:ATP-binding cassette domain-containing protein [Candidatus Methylacidiphilales bacterium]